MNTANRIRRRRRLVALSTLVLVAGLLTMQPGARGAGLEVRQGGIVRVSLVGGPFG